MSGTWFVKLFVIICHLYANNLMCSIITNIFMNNTLFLQGKKYSIVSEALEY